MMQTQLENSEYAQREQQLADHLRGLPLEQTLAGVDGVFNAAARVLESAGVAREALLPAVVAWLIDNGDMDRAREFLDEATEDFATLAAMTPEEIRTIRTSLLRLN